MQGGSTDNLVVGKRCDSLEAFETRRRDLVRMQYIAWEQRCSQSEIKAHERGKLSFDFFRRRTVECAEVATLLAFTLMVCAQRTFLLEKVKSVDSNPPSPPSPLPQPPPPPPPLLVTGEFGLCVVPGISLETPVKIFWRPLVWGSCMTFSGM